MQYDLKSDTANNIFLMDTVIVKENDSLMVNNDSLLIVKQNLAEGKKLYEKKCGRCHALHEPDEFSQKKWKRNLNEMREKAGLSKEQYSLILGYLYSKSRK